jgi:hypothetical protein
MEQERQVATTTTPRFVPEKPETKLSSSSLISTHQVMAVDALHEDAILAPPTPTRYSTFVSASQWEGSVAGARVVNTDQSRSNSFTRLDGTNPRLWRAKCLDVRLLGGRWVCEEGNPR